jgi:hypothetical protein
VPDPVRRLREIRRQQEATARLTPERDRLIRQLYESTRHLDEHDPERWSYGRLAELTGLARSRIPQILAGGP